MNVSKGVALGAIAYITVAGGYRIARAQSPVCNNLPNMTHALEALKEARGFLEKAEHDKGGWRTKAIEATDKAVHQTQAGCLYADTH
jgi:hypothetical protein